MGLGWGFLKQMNDTFKYNRDLLGSKKSAREIYKDEVRLQGSSYENVDLKELRARVAEKLKKDRVQEVVARWIALIAYSAIAVLSIGWIINKDWSIKVDKYANKEALFNTVIYNVGKTHELKVDYYNHGTKAAETKLKKGLRHQNSESYYETGEQFRAALYFRDTLIMETYFYKSGDTIKNFPVLNDKTVHRIRIPNKQKTKRIEFDFFDGKIIRDTYREIELTK
jgi:hypothetical protein